VQEEVAVLRAVLQHVPPAGPPVHLKEMASSVMMRIERFIISSRRNSDLFNCEAFSYERQDFLPYKLASDQRKDSDRSKMRMISAFLVKLCSWS
jgi:hypothetical protein